MAGRCAAGILIAASLGAGAAPRAIAQPAEPAPVVEPAGAPVSATADPKLAKKHLATAQQAMERASYFAARNRPDEARQKLEAAVAAYQRAIEAGGDPNLYLDLAGAEDRLGRSIDAVKHLRLVVAATGARPDAARRAQARLDELMTRVGVVALTVEPAGASITLGGVELGTAPLREPLVLLPGTYTLSFQAAGFQPKEEEIAVAPGATERAIALDPVRVIVTPVPPPAPEPVAPVDRPPPGRLPLYLGAGVTAAAAVSAAVFGALAIDRHATFTDAATPEADREDARRAGRRFAVVTDVSIGAAMVAAGATAWWYFFRYRPNLPDDRTAARVAAKLDVVPWVQSRSGGAALTGWF